jgi:hypothetical protein
MAGWVARWVRFYTRGLPAPIARRRIDEIDADLHDQIADERARGTSEWRIALSILSRMGRGLAADASWRGRHRIGPRSRVARATALILLLPLLAMLVTDEVAWGPTDFALAGALLFGTGRAYQLVATRTGDISYRAAVGVALAAAFMLVWLVGAVGVLGEEGDRADLMYAGVLAVGVLGAVIARFRPDGMARALLATALAQALVAVIALIAGKHEASITSMPELLGLNGLFCALFVGSAWLFRRAA